MEDDAKPDSIRSDDDTVAARPTDLGPTGSGSSEGGSTGYASGAVAPAESIDAGTQVGRYIVTSRIGQGGMGVVYGAFDPELDRKIALKLLHPGTRRQRSDEAQGRLMREAQAIARVSHPNVITVHDVGQHAEQVFVAMEFVDGCTLEDWQTSTRTWREVVSMYVRAGRGLSAAHAAGLVHRDFKPHNVMVGTDGRPRVMDFGLARTASEGAADRAPEVETIARSSLQAELTRTGSVMGTPSYMSPEQMQGLTAEARSDQFSFCVALWEALYAERPFSGETFASLVYAVTTGEIKTPPSGHSVPARLRRALVRGLSVEPAQRFASMDELLRELSVAIARRRRGWLAVGASVAAIVTAYGLGTRRDGGGGIECPSVTAVAFELWPERRKDMLTQAILNVEVPYARHVAGQLIEELDVWTERWAAQRVDACEATHVRHEESEQMLDRRSRCAKRHAQKFEALVEVLERADESRVRNALELVKTLPEPTQCGDPAVLEGEAELPTNADERRALEGIDRELDVIIVLERAGELDQANARLTPLVAEARALARPTLTADVLDVQARLHSGSGQSEPAIETILDALAAAFEGGNSHQTAQIATRAMDYLSHDGQRLAEALRWVPLVRALVKRAGDTLELRVGARNVEASLFREAGRVDEAMAAARDTLAMWEKLEGPTGPNMAWANEHVGLVLQMQGHPDEAVAHLERSLELERARFGSQHPRVATSLNNLGIVYGSLGRVDDCARALEEALQIETAIYGSDHVNLASTLTNLGEVRAMQGRRQEVVELNQRALAMRTEAFGPDHASQVVNYTNLGAALTELDRPDEAVTRLERAVAISTEVYGGDHPDTALALFHIASAYGALGRRDDALEASKKTLEIWRDKLGPEHPNVGAIMVNLGELQRPHDSAQALANMRRGIEILADAYGPEHRDVVLAKGQLAQALLETKHRAEAAELFDWVLARAREQSFDAETVAEYERAAAAAKR